MGLSLLVKQTPEHAFRKLPFIPRVGEWAIPFLDRTL